MKEVMAVIRMNKINQTKDVLVNAGFPAFTGMKAVGRGVRAVDFELLQAISDDPKLSPDVLSSIAQGPRLIPKRVISLVVPDELVPEVVDIITKENQTGNPGDGKIFVLPIEEVYRIRTQQSGTDAIDEMTGHQET